MLVTDKDLLKFKVATKVCDILDEAKIDYEIYDKIKANPTIKMLLKAWIFVNNVVLM